MSWSGAISTLETHLATATSGYQFTIQGGDPGLPAKKIAFWFYVGSAENDLIPTTLNDHPYGEQVSVGFIWPVSQRSGGPSRVLELEVQAVTRAFITAVYGDDSLAENVTHVTVGEAEAGWLNTDQASWRRVTVPLTLGFTDTEPIAR